MDFLVSKFFSVSEHHLLLFESKVFYGQEPRSLEYTATECGDNYQLLAVIY